MIRIVALVLGACSFHPRSSPPSGDDGPIDDAHAGDARRIDARIVDARMIDARMIDARVCPSAPADCTPFTCPGSASCYYVCGANNMKKSWTDARDRCTQANLGCIATINSDPENTCISAAGNPVFPDLIWFGFRQNPGSPEPAGGWAWQCGSSAYLAPNWGMAGGEPNDSGGNEDCAVMGGLAWIDGDCGSQERYVCELP